MKLLERLLDYGELIGGIVDDEIAGEPDGGRLAAEQTGAQRMKGRDPHPAAVRAEQRLDARTHFFGSLVREGDCEDFVGPRMAVADEIGNPARDDTGFS